MRSAKEIIGTIALVVVSILIAYGALEAGLHLTVTHWPAWMFNAQCRELHTLGQTSKAERVPREPYIAILGDSYGSGQGDWFVDNGYNLNSRYHTAHVLQDITGRDVLSLSRAGAGNYDGAAIYAINTFKLLRRVGFELPPPAVILVYFYEGNDISDNLRFKDRYFAPNYDLGRVYDDDYFETFAQSIENRFSQGAYREFLDRFYAGNLLSRTVESLIYSATKKARPIPPGQARTAVINGQAVPLPDILLEDDLAHMTPSDKALGVRFFERALSRVQQFWNGVPRYVVYIPAAPALYQIPGPEAEAIRAASADMEARVRQAAMQNGYGYISATAVLREKAAKMPIHGPTDWHHLNRQGYTTLGECIARGIHVDEP